MSAPAAASVFSVELLGELVRHGVRDVVVCAGSRSQALALAAAAAERARAIRLHVRLDERSAGYFAVGIARETGVPAPVIVTSGTAVANLMPAVAEASEARVPMILLTADRPHEARGVRSNQTTRQAAMFAGFCRVERDIPAPEYGEDGDLVRSGERDPAALAVEAVSASTGYLGAQPPGPVHLDLAFREPLSGIAGFEQMVARGFRAAAEERDAPAGLASTAATAAVRATGGGHESHAGFSEDERYVHSGGARTVVIAGEGAGRSATVFAELAGLPLLAEAVSGARRGAVAISQYQRLIDEAGLGGEIERAVVFGHPTLTRQVPALLRREGVDVVVVDPFTGTDHYLPGGAGSARVVREAVVAPGHDARADRQWLAAWEESSRVPSAMPPADRASSDIEPSGMVREELASLVWQASAPRDRLVLAASNLVRALDRTAAPREVEVHANRGLAGIDGTVATALGVAVASQAGDGAGVTRVLIGDLAMLHDAGSMLLPPGEPRPNLQVIVGNDGGGTIFDGLEVAGTSDPADFERVLTTPQRADFAALAAAYGWGYARVSDAGILAEALEAPAPGAHLIEVPLR